MSIRGTSWRRMTGRCVPMAALLLVACGDFVENIPPRPAASEDPTIAETPYPSLATVPARPQLTYTLEQRREIAEGLVADRSNARYAGDTVRRELDRPVQPDTAPPLPPLPAAATPPATDAEADADADLALAYVEDALARDSDDGSLGDFLERLERRPPAIAAAEPPIEAEAAVEPTPMENEPQSSPPAPATTSSDTPAAEAETEADAGGPRRVPPAPATEPVVAAVEPAENGASPALEATRLSDEPSTADAALPQPSSAALSAASPALPVEILFEPDAVELGDGLEQEMRDLARELRADTSGIVVSGGGERAGLAMERARRVAALLVDAGVPPARIAIEMGGERDVVVVYDPDA